MDDSPSSIPPENSVLRYMAVLRAARDFGVSRADLEEVVRRLGPFDSSPRELADALADRLLADARHPG